MLSQEIDHSNFSSLYGCGSSSLTPREERMLREFQNTVFEEDTWAKRDDLIGTGLSERRS
jgi:hypothetical protein